MPGFFFFFFGVAAGGEERPFKKVKLIKAARFNNQLKLHLPFTVGVRGSKGGFHENSLRSEWENMW